MDIQPDPIAAPIRSLMQLLAGELSAVRFPDVDGDKLAATAREVESAAQAVADAEAAVEAARRVLDDRQEALLGRAHRAFGYLRVFAEGDATLEARLEPIALPRRRGPVEPAALAGAPVLRRRGRPPKNDPGAPLLASVPTRPDAPAPMLAAPPKAEPTASSTMSRPLSIEADDERPAPAA